MPQDRPEHRLHGERRRRLALALLAFLAGAAVLVQEILAAGWIAPLYGSGIDVWAVVLAVSLLALAAGAWIGSISVRRVRGLARVLDVLLTAAACGVAGGMLAARADPFDPPPLAAVALLLLAPALTALGMLPPWLVERYAATGVQAGRAAGITYAAGTLGSAAGALAAGLVLVETLGLVGSALAMAGALATGAVLAAALAATARRRALLLAGVLGLLLICARLAVAGEATGRGAFGLMTIERVDGFYGRHEVLEDDVSRYLLVYGVLQTSAPLLDLGEPLPGSLLAAGNALELVRWLRPEAGRALVVGLGGAAFPRCLVAAGWEVEAVEIDPVIVDLGRRHFGVEVPTVVGDGRRFLNRTRRRYDLIVLDVYRGEHLPGHLVTEEAFATMRQRLAAGGLLAVNLIGAPTGEDVLAVVRAVRTAFPYVRLDNLRATSALTPLTLFASASALERPSSRDRAAADGVPWPESVPLDDLPWARAPRLTDDRNPIALLRRETARAWRSLSVRRFRREIRR